MGRGDEHLKRQLSKVNRRIEELERAESWGARSELISCTYATVTLGHVHKLARSRHFFMYACASGAAYIKKCCDRAPFLCTNKSCMDYPAQLPKVTVAIWLLHSNRPLWGQRVAPSSRTKVPLYTCHFWAGGATDLTAYATAVYATAVYAIAAYAIIVFPFINGRVRHRRTQYITIATNTNK